MHNWICSKCKKKNGPNGCCIKCGTPRPEPRPERRD
jgi:hypothetical protein